MRSLFYPKLAITNIRKNGKIYFPYMLTGILTVAMFYIIYSMVYNKGLNEMPRTMQLIQVLSVGIRVVAIFAVIFIFYTNSFLIKRRKKELGLYNVLGMGKGHLAKMLFCETLITAAVDIVAGLIFGLVFSKLMFLVLVKITHLDVPLKFMVAGKAMAGTVLLFALIFLATLLYNMWQVLKVNTIELLHGQNQGEREPKTKLLMTLIGIVTLGAGYYIAVTTESPMDALGMFFVAVVLVIIGTYALFTTGSIAILKALRKNKNYYYKTSHFISVSGMIYRMKQNAVGLANICILSTMVLVMVSTTVSLYAGMSNILETRFPYEFAGYTYTATEEQIRDYTDQVEEKAAEEGITIENKEVYLNYIFFVGCDEENSVTIDGTDYADSVALTMIPLSFYNDMQGTNVTLEENEILVNIPEKGSPLKVKEGEFQLGNQTMTVKKVTSDLVCAGKGTMNMLDEAYVIVPDFQAVEPFIEEVKAVEEKTELMASGTIGYDFKGSKQEKEAFLTEITELFGDSGMDGRAEVRETYREEFYGFYGGFLFLGVFFGSLFLMATVLIIYYKQISEGYDDKERFQIMQKVGMGRREVKKSIRSQVVSVFFLPLVMAVLHICVAFGVITKLLALMNLTDVDLFRNCTIITVLVFGVIYGVVYMITAREYYRIVK